MLYEVITPPNRWGASIAPEMGRHHHEHRLEFEASVITSYSIHYTKLYEAKYFYKINKGKTALLRWLPQIVELRQGVDIFSPDSYIYPHPPFAQRR